MYVFKTIYHTSFSNFTVSKLNMQEYQYVSWRLVPLRILKGAFIHSCRNMHSLRKKHITKIFHLLYHNHKEPDAKVKLSNRFGRTRSIKLFIGVALFLLMISFLDMTFIDIFDRMLKYCQMNILLIIFNCLYSVIFKIYEIHYHYATYTHGELDMMDEKKRYVQYIYPQAIGQPQNIVRFTAIKNSLTNTKNLNNPRPTATSRYSCVPTTLDQLIHLQCIYAMEDSERKSSEMTQFRKKIVLSFMSNLDGYLTYLIVFCYSLFPRAPSQNSLCYIFRHGSNSAIVRDKTGDNEMRHCIFNLEDQLLKIRFMIVNLFSWALKYTNYSTCSPNNSQIETSIYSQYTQSIERTFENTI